MDETDTPHDADPAPGKAEQFAPQRLVVSLAPPIGSIAGVPANPAPGAQISTVAGTIRTFLPFSAVPPREKDEPPAS
jgi:hypothetical protein